MKLSITPINDGNSEVQNAVPDYDIKLNGVSLTDTDADFKITELNLNMRAGTEPKLTIHTELDPMVVKNLLVNVDVKQNDPDR